MPTEEQLVPDISVSVVIGDIEEFVVEPQAVDAVVVPALIEIMPISGLYNPPIYDADVAIDANISVSKINQTELAAFIHTELDDDLLQLSNDIDYLEQQVSQLQGMQGGYVTLTGAQTIAGAKTFQGTVIVPISSGWTTQEAVAMTVLNTRVPGQIRVGTTVPAAALGANGDFYFQYTP